MDNNETLTLDLSSTGKKKITVDNGTDTRDLYLNLSDMNLVVRFKEKYDELKDLENTAFNKLSNTSETDVLETADILKDVDLKMRNALDYIFDANVSETCAPFGSMYDLLNGKLRYESILDSLATLYDKNIHEETAKLEKRLSKHTDKYVRK